MEDAKTARTSVTCLPQGDRTLFFDRFHREVRGHGFQFDVLDQALVDPIIPGHVADHDLEKVVVFTADAEEIDHLGNLGNMSPEGLKPRGGMVSRLDQRENDETAAKPGTVNHHCSIADNSRRFQRFEPAPASILRKPNPVCKRPLRLRRVALKLFKNPKIKLIEFSTHTSIIRPKNRKSTAIKCEDFSMKCGIMRLQLPGNDMTSLDEFKQTLAGSDIRDRIRDGLIGENVQIEGPYGKVPLIYADYVASGRALVQVEDFIRDRVLPYYANTHTQASFCGEFMTRLREAARSEIKRLIGAGPETSVVFTGSGSTAGINRIVGLLDLAGLVRQGRKAVVLIGPYEHHSNILPWRETGAEVIEIAEAREGGVDMDDLSRALDVAAGADQVVGSFSAASNVTGILTDVDAVTRLLRSRGAVSVWDYGCAGPYCDMDMKSGTDAEKDAIVFSAHKFPGGPGASGITVIRDAIVQRATPTLPGGGTVSFVSPWGHVYSGSVAAREEGGTPNVTGDIRAALALLVKEALGQDWLGARQEQLRRRALKVWRRNDRIELLGIPEAPALPIFSFRVRDGQGGLLHHQFFTRLLSDVTGVQARGGCACAGPYGHRLLGLGKSDSDMTIAALERGEETAKPGWVRLNLSALMNDAKVDMIINAVDALSRVAPDYASDYSVDAATARFRIADTSRGSRAS